MIIDFRNKVPLILMLVSLVLMTCLAMLKFQSWNDAMLIAGSVVVTGYLIWLVSESNIALSEDEKGKTQKDRNTCELYVLGRFLTVIFALLGSTHWDEINVVMVLGVLVFFCGVLFRLHAIRTLGKFYSHRVRLFGDHEVIDTGPYAYVRHPAYTGMLLAHLGFVLVFFNYWALLALFFVLLPAITQRIKIEEFALRELKGYTSYAATHKRLIPMLW